MDNPYLKLEEAGRIYLNPTLDLVTSDVNLADHCYYIIKKWPPHEHILWTSMVQHDWTTLFETKPKSKSKKSDCDSCIIANLKLAVQKNDQAYMDFMLAHRPSHKTTLNLTRKNPMISPELATAMEIADPSKLSAVILKQQVNHYILKP